MFFVFCFSDEGTTLSLSFSLPMFLHFLLQTCITNAKILSSSSPWGTSTAQITAATSRGNCKCLALLKTPTNWYRIWPYLDQCSVKIYRIHPGVYSECRKRVGAQHDPKRTHWRLETKDPKQAPNIPAEAPKWFLILRKRSFLGDEHLPRPWLAAFSVAPNRRNYLHLNVSYVNLKINNISGYMQKKIITR